MPQMNEMSWCSISLMVLTLYMFNLLVMNMVIPKSLKYIKNLNLYSFKTLN